MAFGLSALVVVPALSAGFAATLPVHSVQLAVFAGTVVEVPAGLVDTGFDALPPGPLNGAGTETGQTWAVHTGGFTVGTGGAVQAATTGRVTATVEAGVANVVVTGVMIFDQPRNAGVMLNANASGTSYFAVVYDHQVSGRVRVWKVTNGVTATAATATQLGTSAVATLRVTHLDGTYTVFLQGAQVLSYVMTPAERAAFASNTRHGILVDTDTRTSFDEFHVEVYP